VLFPRNEVVMSKLFVQYGAGNIGRGFIGALFSQAGYEVKFIDVVPQVISLLNSEHCYPVRIVDTGKSEEVWIQNVSAVDGMDMEQVAETIAQADLMATAVGVNILPRIIPNILAGLRLRWAKGNLLPFNIIICENLLDADKFMHGLLFEQLDDHEKQLFEETVGLVEASIGRMVPVMSEEMKEGNPLRVWVERYCQLPVDEAAIKGQHPQIENLRPYSPFHYYIRRKLFVHNMGHALTAYLGNILGLQTIWQTIQIPEVKLIAERAMHESALALSKEYNMPLAVIEEHITDLLLRFENAALGDTVARVGRDTRRKLGANDRLAGAAALCDAQGILPVYISVGIAAALCFSDEKGTEIADTILKQKGTEAVLTEICGIENGAVRRMILAYYEALKKKDIAVILALAESFQKEELSRRIVI